MRLSRMRNVSLLAIFLIHVHSAEATPVAGDEPSFVETPCNFAELSAEARARLRCGTVAVPRDYQKPAAGQYELAVMVVRSRAQPGRPEPAVYLPAGPGASRMKFFASFATLPDSPVAAKQDLIVFDTRGSGSSEPHVCASGAPRFLEYAAPDQSTRTLIENARAQYAECVADARRMHISPEWFGTHVTVEDVERIRRALRVPRWDAFGIAYGTVIGAALAARYPDTLRSLVLDSVILPAQKSPLPISVRSRRSLHMLFAACEGDLACAAKYPALDAVWAAALQRLERKPLSISMPAEAAVRGGKFILNRGDLEILVFTALYGRYADVPALITAAAEGRGDELVPALMESQQEANFISLFGSLSVLCRDDPNALSGRLPGASRDDEAGYEAMFPGPVCDEWTKPGPPPEVPQNTSVRTLILQGELDPISPPINGMTLAKRLGQNAVFAQVPSVAHAVGARSACAAAILDAFFENPAKRPDLSCIADPASIRFR